MELKNQKDQISDDQFGNAESTPVNPENEENLPLDESSEATNVVSSSTEEAVKEPKKVKSPKKLEVVEEAQVESLATSSKTIPNEVDHEEVEELEQIDITPDEIEAVDEDEEEEEDQVDDEEDADESTMELESVDYSTLTREELVDRLAKILEVRPVQRIRADVESIKVNFYKKHKAEYERKRKEWVDAGGDIAEFEAPADPMEPQIKELLKQYRDKKSDFNRDLEVQKVKNLEIKQGIIEQIKELVNRNESVNQTFQDFRELQQKWRETGPVPQANLNDLWETYHHHVQNFYD